MLVTFNLKNSFKIIAAESKAFFRWTKSKLKLGIRSYLNDICIHLGFCGVKYVLISLGRSLSLSYLIFKSHNPPPNHGGFPSHFSVDLITTLRKVYYQNSMKYLHSNVLSLLLKHFLHLIFLSLLLCQKSQNRT